MALYRHISSATTTTLITKGGTDGGGISEILIANDSANDATITLDLYTGSGDPFIIVKTVIPSNVSLLLDNKVYFNKEVFNLRLTNTGTSPSLTVIIK